MNKRTRTATVLAFAFTFIALWIAFVTMGDEPLDAEWPLPWLPPFLATILLIGALFLAGLMVRSDQELRTQVSSAKATTAVQMFVAALVVVGAVLGLVTSLRFVLWGGPTWQRWAIIGLAIATLLAGSGRAMGRAVIAGLVWAAFGTYIGRKRAPTELVDLFLTGLFVGTTVGAVAGTILLASLRRKGQDGS
jgi:hypothetical protein